MDRLTRVFYREARLIVERIIEEDYFLPNQLREVEPDVLIHFAPQKGYGFIFKNKDSVIVPLHEGDDDGGFVRVSENEMEAEKRLKLFRSLYSNSWHIKGWFVMFATLVECESLIAANGWVARPIKIEFNDPMDYAHYDKHWLYEYFAYYAHLRTYRKWIDFEIQEVGDDT